VSKNSVFKFGGSSVKDATSMRRCFSLIKADPNCRIIVVSATYNTTNQLEVLGQLCREGKEEELQERWKQLQKKHEDILEDFTLPKDILNGLFCEYQQYLQELITNKSCNVQQLDRLYAFGELCSSIIFVHALKNEGVNAKWLDARQFLKTNSDFHCALPNQSEIKNLISPMLIDHDGVFVTQGYIGSDESCQVTTLGREGSDYSATLIGEASEAKEVVIWTDVDGIWSADPRLVPDAQKIETLSYDQAQWLAEGGAKVLFPRTLDPARRSSMVVRVASSLDATKTGTFINGHASKVRAQAIDMFDEHFSLLTFLGDEKDFELLKNFSQELELQEQTSEYIKFKIPHSIALDMFRDTHAALRKTVS
jgi:aspartate kinase